MLPMVDPVLNTPRNQWYQKQHHCRLPRKAESKKWLDAKYTLVGGSDVIVTPPANVDHIVWTDNSRLSDVTLITPLPATLTWSADVGGGVPGLILATNTTGGGALSRAYMQWNGHVDDGVYQYLHLMRGTQPGGTTKYNALPFVRSAFNAGKTALTDGYLVGPRCVTAIADRFNITEATASVEATIATLDSNRVGTFAAWRWTDILVSGSLIAIRSYTPGTVSGSQLDWTEAVDETCVSGIFGFGYQQGSSGNTIAIAEMIYTPLTQEQEVLIQGELAAYTGIIGPHVVTVTGNQAAWKP